MPRKMSFPFMVVWLIASWIAGCRKIESYPPEPYIEYERFEVRDSTDMLGNQKLIGSLWFYFVDGDGDVGAADTSDTSGKYNLFFTMFEKIDGEFYEVGLDKLGEPIRFIIPFMERTGQNKTLKGEINVEFEYYFNVFDTIRYDFYITDRAGNYSNIESTPELVLEL
ncbi:MAG: hypothetical protein ACP5D1_09445 [Bacteroidales bacterium]